MAKTELTLRIEDRLFYYDPETTGGQKINKFRNRHIAYEVPVTTGTVKDGLVDCMRIDEILVNGRKSFACNVGRHPEWYRAHHPTVMNYMECKKGFQSIDELPEYCDERTCTGNCMLNQYDNEICVTCYEIKISKEDFHSPHGHNFCGNANYYVMPEDLYKTVKNEISDEIGVIIYRVTDTAETLRRVKECVYKQLDHNAHRWLILNVMKKMHSWKSVEIINKAARHIHNMIPHECITCDFQQDCPYPESCNIVTHNPEHSSRWECQDEVLRSAGILLGKYGDKKEVSGFDQTFV